MRVSKASRGSRGGTPVPEPSPFTARTADTVRGSVRSSWMVLIVCSCALIVLLLPIPLALREARERLLAPDLPRPAEASGPAVEETGPQPIEAPFHDQLVRPLGDPTRLEVEEEEGSLVEPEAERPVPIEAHHLEARLEIEVLDELGRPVRDARVEVLTVDAEEREERVVRSCDAAGRLVLLCPAGWAQLVAWSENGAAGPVAVEPEAGKTSELELVLAPTLGVSGRVVDAGTAAPIPGARVSFWTFSETDVVLTDGQGRFHHPRYPGTSSAQQVRVEAPGYGAAVRYLEVEPNGRWTLASPFASGTPASGSGEPFCEVALAPELVVHGLVLDENGEALAGATVVAEGYFHVLPSLASRDTAEATTNRDGQFVLSGLRSDIGHAVVVRADGHAAKTVEVHPGTRRTALIVDLSPATEVSGVVVDPDGIPVEDIELALHRRDERELPPGEAGASGLDAGARVEGRLLRTRTGPEGTFAFDALEPGTYTVQVLRDQGVLAEEEVLVGTVSAPLDVVLHLPAESLVLVGEVRDDHGAIPNARVDVLREGLVSSVTADGDGRFRVAGLDAAQYALQTTGRCPSTGRDLRGEVLAWSFERPVVRLGEP